ncbi:MAG: biotin--[acetyl-CoA-carboxylase] ligase [Gemmataceae bacterium]
MIRAVWEYPERCIGRQVIVYSQTDSTNNRALAHAGQPGLAFLADEQTAGRGTQGRRWNAQPGASVLLSVLLHPPQAWRRPVILTAWAAVSVQDTLASWGLSSQIKWPNDVQLAGRKIAGILTEIHGKAVVVGIGLNVRQTAQDWQQAGLTEATSLKMAGVDQATERVAHQLLECLETRYRVLVTQGQDALESSWQTGLGLIGQSVQVQHPGGTTLGRISQLSFERVGLEDGRVWRPEEVRLSRIESPGRVAS